MIKDGITNVDSIPPWRFFLLYVKRQDRSPNAETRTHVVFQFHHSLADGFNMARIVLQALSPLQMPEMMGKYTSLERLAREKELLGAIKCQAGE